MNIQPITMSLICDTVVINKKTVADVRRELPGFNRSVMVAEMFKALADPNRIRIIEALSIMELCVCDLAHLLGMSQSAMSHQLRILRQNGAVKYRREGQTIYYSLDDEHVADLLHSVSTHISHRGKGR